MRSLGAIWPKCSVIYNSSNIGYLDYSHGILSEVGNSDEIGNHTYGFVSEIYGNSQYQYNHISSIGEQGCYLGYTLIGRVG